MTKKNRLLLSAFCFLLLSTSANVQNQNSFQNELLYSKFKDLSYQQFFDTANYYFQKSSYDTAMFCYNFFMSNFIKSNDVEQQKDMIRALNRIGIIYMNMSDYASAYKYFIDALNLSEKYKLKEQQARTYSNFGVIYCHFKEYEIGNSYFYKALSLYKDSIGLDNAYNNIGYTYLMMENLDSAFHYLNKSLQISQRHNTVHLSAILNSMASYYKKSKQYHSAFRYFKLALDEARKGNQTVVEAYNLSEMSKLFFELNKPDSALYYIGLSNALAKENIFLNTLAENYLTLSEFEESRGNTKKAFEYFKKHSQLKDSVLNTEILGNINQLQRMYEISKTNEQIEQFEIEQKIKERTIFYQRMLWLITLGVLFLVSVGFLFIYLQNRRLYKAYKVLVKKNIEIVDFQKNISEIYHEKYKKNVVAYNLRNDIVDKILQLMKNTALICDTEFSLNKLTELVDSNQTYVSQTINFAFKKNFRTLLNDYRIREAQRLFSDPAAAKYTIESVSLQVGFKARSAFINAFKEITGVTPNFYLKSMNEQDTSI
jgi:tetratricopeptide (TPR) repeat protein